MDNKLKWGIIIAVIIVLSATGLYFLGKSDRQKIAKLDEFAQCIKDSGAVFYGAFWCPHCQSQKQMFKTMLGNAEKNLPYVECSAPDGRSQIQACKDANIQVYPTWKFADGTTKEGQLTFQEIASLTGCKAPE